jgi:hypothetical protein
MEVGQLEAYEGDAFGAELGDLLSNVVLGLGGFGHEAGSPVWAVVGATARSLWIRRRGES